eukprot:TRINITY_DN109392_c0_g1_i1.p1 TRINITY_DN109392_c0_g1~~TRINITY_DN109392_c0_g1_i1.p1  ORF type:complete len:330 (+),score=50.06 TRINITY_DN109392_c0_g1_i1:172-1161(+)
MESSSEFTVLLRGSTLGGVVLCVAGTPLDVARHAVQAAASRKQPSPGFMEAFRASVAPATTGLWRGLTPAVAYSVTAPLAFLLGYEAQRGGTEVIQAGMAARAFQTAACQPFDFFRTCRQAVVLLPEKEQLHLLRSSWDVVTQDGPRTVWRGLIPTLWRDVPASGIFWWGYLGLSNAVLSNVEHWEETFDPAAARKRALQSAGISSVCAAVAAVATQPLDVIKTKMQTYRMITSNREGFRRKKVQRFFKTIRDIYSALGWRGFWLGVAPRMVCAAVGGLLLGPFFEFGQLISEDSSRPLRRPLILGDDPGKTIVHPRSTRDMFIEVKGA